MLFVFPHFIMAAVLLAKCDMRHENLDMRISPTLVC